MTDKRNANYDLIRVIGMFMVIMIHICIHFFYQEGITASEFMYVNIFDSISRIAVPMFLMLSGALLLDENRKSDKETTFRRVKKIVIIILFWSFFYAFYKFILIPLRHGSEILWSEFIKAFALGNYHMWYLYMLVALYLITPILKVFVNKEHKDIVLYFLILSFIFESLITTTGMLLDNSVIVKFIDSFEASFVKGTLIYYVGGWYIANTEISDKNRKIIYVLGIMGLIFTIAATYKFSMDWGRINESFYGNTRTNVLFYAVAVFVFITKGMKEIKNKTAVKVINFMAGISLGVYMVHAFFVDVIYGRQLVSGVFMALPFDIALTSVMSVAAAYIISKIPVLKKTI